MKIYSKTFPNHFCMLLIAVSLLFISCAAKRKAPDLSILYNRAAQYHDEKRNPVILIPGILGSKLVDSESGRLVWGAFAGGYANPQKPDGARLFALPMREGAALGSLRDSVVSDGALDRLKVNFLGLPFELDAYADILGALGLGGYRDEQLGIAGAIDYGGDHFTCFQFDHDWRRDNVENARLLHEFILEKRAYVQAEIEKRFGIENYNVKFDLVAHSMGGLIARYYLRFGAKDLPEDDSIPLVTWEGSRFVERAILVGPPNAGSVEALVQLVEGRKFAMFLPKYDPAILGTMPAAYQGLPRGRHGALVEAAEETTKTIEDIFNPELWEKMGWGLAAANQDKVLQWLLPDVTDLAARRRIALDHQRKCLRQARQFTAALDVPATPPDSLTLLLIAGDALATTAVISVDRSNGEIKVIKKAAGDGTVLRSSALMDERLSGEWAPALVSPIRWAQVLFVFTEHLKMTKDPAFTDNMLYMLLEHPR